jgi:hypothetical protein
MNRIFLFVIAATFALAINATSFAQVEPIGPILVVPNQPIDLVFPNFIPPKPDHKILRFIGTAHLTDSIGGEIPVLDIKFDYIDPITGGLVLVPPPTSKFLVPVGAGPVPIDTGDLILPFCPQQVSIDLNATGGFIEATGDFSHICVEVPEPASAGLLVVAAMGLLLRRARH